MRDADAPQVEPLKLTLEEAIVELAKHDRLSLRCYPASFGVPAEWAALSPAGWVRGSGDAWHEAVSEALGRPVVPRDPAAELVEALARVLDKVAWGENAGCRGCGAWGYQEHQPDCAVGRAEAALARVRSEP